MKKFFSSKFVLSALAVLFTGYMSAVTYYVSPTGNDNAAGTSSTTAWQSIAKINSMNVAPGTIILFEGGKTFSGSLYFNNLDANDTLNKVTISSYGNGRAILNSGAAAGFYAYNTKGFTLNNLIFEGSGMSTNSADGIMVYTDLTGGAKLGGVSLKNLEVRNYGKVGITIGGTTGGFRDLLIEGVNVHDVKQNGITTWGANSTGTSYSHENLSIKKSVIYNIPGYSDPGQHKGSGIIMGQVSKGLIENTVAHHTGASNTHCGGPGGIWAWDCNNITIQFCESYKNSSGTGCDGLGFDFDGGVVNSLMQYNYSHDNDGAGYLLGQYDYARPWTNNVVRYNISENDGRTNAGGIMLFKGAGTTMSGCKIYNNTIYTSPSASNPALAAFRLQQWNTGITGVEVYNNIFQTTGGVPLVDVPTGYSAYFAGNLYWSSGGVFKINYQGTTYSNLNTWRTATGNEKSGSLNTGIVADPMLIGAGTGVTVYPNPTNQLANYKFLGTSPAIDAGLNLSSMFNINAGARDFYGNTSPAGAGIDIGAFESPMMISTGLGTIGNVPVKEISVFPNPVKHGEGLTITGAQGLYSVEVISLTGAVIFKETKINTPTFRIPSLNLATAIYLVNVVEDESKKQVVKKILIE
jgi:hypothetical protein